MSPSVTVRLLATQSDARLVELARQGHERAFEALVQRYRRPLLAYCRRALLPEARAEDALQQALLQAWLALQRGDEVRDARAWLYRIVRNTALNALRGSGYDYAELSEALSGAGAPHEDLDRRIAVREALAGLAALPEQQREALLRTAVEGASHADAALEMGVSESAVRGLVHRARMTLRAGLTAITPMPLATWAAGAAGHGGAAAELALGGGSAGLAGLLAKSGAVVVTAGVLAAGVGTVEHHRHAPDGARRSVHAARVAATHAVTGATVVDAARPVEDSPVLQHPSSRLRRRDPILAPAGREHAPEALVRTRDGERAPGDGGEPSRHDMSGGDHGGQRDGGGGSASGGRGGDDRPPGSQPAPAPSAPAAGGDGGQSGSGDQTGGDGGTSGSGGDTSGDSGGDGSTSGSGDTGSTNTTSGDTTDGGGDGGTSGG